eukprot:m.45662 g.45662  ORF g.45662 m.45662 type:complete len:424 (+) comp6679_c0_seq1:270-1541(+)
MAYESVSLWDVDGDDDPFAASDDTHVDTTTIDSTTEDIPLQTSRPRSRRGSPVKRSSPARSSTSPSQEGNPALPAWHTAHVPGVPRHVATGSAGTYAAASVPRGASPDDGADAADIPPRPQGVSQAEWDRYIWVIQKAQASSGKGAKRGRNAKGAASTTKNVTNGQGQASVYGSPPARRTGATPTAKPVGTSDAEWARYLAAVGEAKRQARLAPTEQTYIHVDSTVDRGPQLAKRTVAEQAIDLGTTPLAAIKEFQARERGKQISAAAAARMGASTPSPKQSPKLKPKQVENVKKVADSPEASPKTKRKNKGKKGSPKIGRIALRHAEGHDDDWVFGEGLRQGERKKSSRRKNKDPVDDEASIFPVAPPPPSTKPKPTVTAAAPEEDTVEDRPSDRKGRRQGELRRNPDSDDDDLFGGAAGVF